MEENNIIELCCLSLLIVLYIVSLLFALYI